MRFISFFLVLLAPAIFGNMVLPDGEAEIPTRQGKDYALFFAVEDYAHMGKLTNPIDNARAIAEELRENYGFRTEVVENPSFNDIADKLAVYQQKFASGAYDQKGQLLIFFSGHGVQRGNNGYFIPADGNPDRLFEKVLEYDYWRNEIDRIDCQHILVTIDACHSLTFDPNWVNKTDRGFGRRGDQTKDQVRLDHDAYRARLFITSDGTNNQTPDRSSLARQFLTGLRTHRSPAGYLSSEVLYSNYLRNAAPVPGGGDFGRDEPGSRFLFFREQANPILSDTRAELAAWHAAQAQDDCAAYRAYLQRFPSGDFATMARRKIAPCEAEERMLAAWQNAKARNDCDTYDQFAKDYPESAYAGLVPERRKALGCVRAASPDNMILIPGGTFQMGDQFGDGERDEKPVHAVTVSDFYLSRTELTNRDFAEFLSSQGNQKQGDDEWYDINNSLAGIMGTGRNFYPKKGLDDHPVTAISWYGAVAYCNWLSGQHGLEPVYRVSGTTVTPDWSANGYRLPTEAEWEYAARSGGKKEKWAGTSTASSLGDFANYGGEEDGYARTAPVGMLRANNLGLFDMSGNVYELCWDWHGLDYYGKSPASNPRGPDSGVNRVIRGGNYYYDSSHSRAADRRGIKPTRTSVFTGFRLARGL